MCIGQATLTNDKQHQPRTARTTGGVWASTGRYQRWKMSGSIRQGMCASWKQCRPMKSGINKAILFMVARIGRGQCTLLSWYWSWIARISHRLFTSLRHYRALTSHITFGHYKMLSRYREFIAVQHNFWPAHSIKSTTGIACTLWSADVRCGLHALPLTCTQRLIYVRQGLPPCPEAINIGLFTSNVTW